MLRTTTIALATGAYGVKIQTDAQFIDLGRLGDLGGRGVEWLLGVIVDALNGEEYRETHDDWLAEYRRDMFIDRWGSPQDPHSEYSKNCERLQDGLDEYGVMKCTQGLIHPDGEYEQIAGKVAEAAEWKQNHSDWLSDYEQDVFLRSWNKHDYNVRCTLL